MTSGNSEKVSDLDKAREWLDLAAEWLKGTNGWAGWRERGYAPGMSHADAAARIGAGYAALAQVAAIGSAQSSEALPPELRAAIRRSVQAAEEARPHDDEPVRCAFEGCGSRALSSGRCGLLAHAVPPSECGCGGPLAHDSEDPRCAYFAGRGTYRG